VESSRWPTELRATRGDPLALFRVEVSGQVSEAGVASEEHLTLSEVDAEGRSVAIVLFAVDDVDAAYDELDRRFQASEAGTGGRAEATVTFRRAFAIRDWDLLATTLAPDVAVIDHRLLGWDTLRGPEAYVQALRSLVELAPDTRLRVDHLIRTTGRKFLYVPTWVGTREGGAFETPSVIVCELDGTGRFRRFEVYDLDQLDEAAAHYEQLRLDAGEPLAAARTTR